MAVRESPTPLLARSGAIPENKKTMYYVYLLKSGKDLGYYIGFSSNLKFRFKQHCNGLVDSTKHRRPLRLIYYEAYNNKNLAEERERKLKKFGSAYSGLLKRISEE